MSERTRRSHKAQRRHARCLGAEASAAEIASTAAAADWLLAAAAPPPMGVESAGRRKQALPSSSTPIRCRCTSGDQLFAAREQEHACRNTTRLSRRRQKASSGNEQGRETRSMVRSDQAGANSGLEASNGQPSRVSSKGARRQECGCSRQRVATRLKRKTSISTKSFLTERHFCRPPASASTHGTGPCKQHRTRGGEAIKIILEC